MKQNSRRPFSSGARGREFEFPRSDQLNQTLSFERGTRVGVYVGAFNGRTAFWERTRSTRVR